MKILRESQICFAIARLGSTGVDDDNLDTLFWLTPFRSKIALQQSMGRIQRRKAGKKTPVMVVFEDWMVPSLKRMCGGIKTTLRHWHFDFEVLKPQRHPLELLPQERARYDAAYASLTAEDDRVEEVDAEG
jgi:superfamily II DNA or RNA helicase